MPSRTPGSLAAESYDWEQILIQGRAESNARWSNFYAHRLPERDTSWFPKAACKPFIDRTGEDLWFYEPEGPESEYHDPRARNTRRAKAVCFSCPVRQECLKDAIDRGDDNGIWGGLTVSERRQLRRELRNRQVAA
jgi:WhiB family redox-sensing transcriptional regulator